MKEAQAPDEPHWLTRPEIIRRLWWGGCILLALLTVGGLFARGYAYFWLDGVPAFFAWYGLATCAAMIVFAKFLGLFLCRKDTYYDE